MAPDQNLLWIYKCVAEGGLLQAGGIRSNDPLPSLLVTVPIQGRSSACHGQPAQFETPAENRRGTAFYPL
jgi:hypothetical protein